MFTLTGTLRDHGGNPHANAQLLIQPTPEVTIDPEGDVVYIEGRSVTTDEAGHFTTELRTAPDLWYTIRSVGGGPLSPRRFLAREVGETVDLADLLPIPAPSPFAEYVRGASAYEVAVAEGFVGTRQEWLASLEGEDGDDGASAYEVAVAAGFEGTEAEWLASLVGAPSTEPGPAGDPTPFELRGTGNPNGQITANPGIYYTDTAGTNGAWRWLKTTGTGNTGWDVVTGDTGPRDVPTWIPTGHTVNLCRVRRVGQTVFLNLDIALTADGMSSAPAVVPAGFRPGGTTAGGTGLRLSVYNSRNDAAQLYMNRSGSLFLFQPVAGATVRQELVWSTPDPWPTTLPGTPA